MKIIHIIHNDWNKEQKMLLSSYGIKVELGYDRFDIEEGDLYDTLIRFFKKWKVEQSFGTIYNNKDITDSSLLVYVSTWVNGYPQPEDVTDFIKAVYDTKFYCNKCGVGAKQTKPFRLKKEPNWGRKKTF